MEYAKVFRNAVLRALAKLGVLTDEVIPEVVAALTCPDSPWDDCGTMFRPIASALIPHLRELLQSSDTVVRCRVLAILGDLQPEAVEALPDVIAQLDFVNSEVLRSALQTMGRFGEAASSAVDRVLPLLRHGNLHTRRAARDCLGKFGVMAAERLGDIVTAWRRDDCLDAPEYIGLFCELGKHTQAVIPLLCEVVRTGTFGEVGAAIQGLGQFGPVAAEAIPDVLGVLSGSDNWLRLQAVNTLGKIGVASPEVVAELRRLQRHPDAQIHTSATAALAKLGM